MWKKKVMESVEVCKNLSELPSFSLDHKSNNSACLVSTIF